MTQFRELEYRNATTPAPALGEGWGVAVFSCPGK